MKNAQSPIQAELSAQSQEQYNSSFTFPGTKNPRQLRVIDALLLRARSRTEIDQIAGASNGPQVIAHLRRLGLTIPCELIQAIDRDGLSVSYGLYKFTAEDFRKIRSWKESIVKTYKDPE